MLLILYLSADTVILVASEPQHFRKGIDSFVAGKRQQNPRADIRFIVINRNRTMIRVLTCDGTGSWLMTKQLSKVGSTHGGDSVARPESA